MKLDDRICRIQKLEDKRIVLSRNDIKKYPWTNTEKYELLQISNIGTRMHWDDPIYTYVKYEYLRKYWMGKRDWKIYFSNPKNFPDPYDSLIYKVPVKSGNSFLNQDPLLKDVFVSCWTKYKESELHWNCYGRDEKSVCIVSTPRKIMQNIYDYSMIGSYNFFFFGNVIYKNTIDVEKSIKRITWNNYNKHDYCIELLFLKTKEHMNEKEIRFVFYDATNDKKKKSKIWSHNAEYAKVKVNSNKVFDKIIINPNLDKGIADSLISEIQHAGFINPIEKSTLYDNPNIYIDISKK